MSNKNIKKKLLIPGEEQAVKFNCTCPTMDNIQPYHNIPVKGGYVWFIDDNCPLHKHLIPKQSKKFFDGHNISVTVK